MIRTKHLEQELPKLSKPVPQLFVEFVADEDGVPLEMEYHDPIVAPSAAPHLRGRFHKHHVEDIRNEHDGFKEKIDDKDGGQVHAKEGWSAENVLKFLENEMRCRALFGTNWDGRYGRSRVRSAATGEMRCRALFG